MLNRHLIPETRPVALAENMVFFKNYRITVLQESLFRIEQNDNLTFCDEATQSIWFRDFPQTMYRIETIEDKLCILTEKATVVVDDDLKKSYCKLASEEKISLFNKGNLQGTCETLDGCSGNMRISYDENGKEHIIPLVLEEGVISREGVALLDDSDSLILQRNGMIKVREEQERDIYVFAFGHDYRNAVKALYALAGQVPLLPRYALGNWWSRYKAYTQKEYLHLMDSFEKSRIPFTVATIDMDWHWSDTLDEKFAITQSGKNDLWHGGTHGWTGYSWNRELFPDYREFLDKLQQKNLAVTLNLHPAMGVRYFEDCYKEMANAVGIDPQTEQCVAFDMTDEKFINAYFEILHRPYEKDGVSFWWIDWQQGNESKIRGLKPLWALNHYHFLDNALYHTPLILSRYCGIGSHRYPIGFSGDTYVTWETLQYMPYFTATAANIGYGWWSHDIGGHMLGSKDDELYIRFIQFGVFSPINRLHSSCCETFSKEPGYFRNGVGKIAEEYLRFRHRLIPFLYTASYVNREEGRVLIEPMYYEYPEDKEAYQCQGQYLFGKQLLVAPIVSKSIEYGISKTRVWLPKGRWTDIFTGFSYEGGKTVEMYRYLEEIPVLASQGTILVLDGGTYTNRVDNPETLEVWLFNGNGEYTLYEEYGDAPVKTVFVLQEDGHEQRLKFSAYERKRTYNIKRNFIFTFKNITFGEVEVLKNGKKIVCEVDDSGQLSVIIQGFSYDDEYEIVIHYYRKEEERYRNILAREIACVQWTNEEKEKLYDNIAKNPTQSSEYIENSGLPEIYKKRLLEIEMLGEAQRRS